QLDPRPLKAAFEQAQAALARDQATLFSNQKDAARYAMLATQGAASSQQRDQSEAAAKAMAATVISDQAAVDAAKLNMVYAQIRSPVDGKTGPILVQPGNLVTADATTPLVVITQIHPVKISFFLPQSDLPQIQSQMKDGKLNIVMSEHGSSGKTLNAPVDFVGNAVDDKTGTIELRATYDNEDNFLVPGQLVDVSVAITQYPHAIVVPHNAINLGPNGSYLYVVGPDKKAQMRAVSVLYDDGANATLKSGAKAGDRVIVEGQMRVVPGATVSIRKGGKPSAAAPQ
ncbi:MAG TPA: efflux RND transporter periplasmic adaptor subunit, partial [Rhizomicrobium sp.]|nr:efflux RND transporter periplasmic adaptor subunit [Rhizomicrobium sp.]